MEIEDLEKLFDSIPIKVGGYAVFRNQKNGKYYFIEHPVEEMWLINKDFWYNHTREEFDKFELLHYST